MRVLRKVRGWLVGIWLACIVFSAACPSVSEDLAVALWLSFRLDTETVNSEVS